MAWDWQPVFNLLGTGVLAVVGYFVTRVIDDNKATAAALAAHQLDVARNYVTHTDLGDIKRTLERIENKLDGKADK
jgi:hypothetical protein